jgi:hypothetical protein
MQNGVANMAKSNYAKLLTEQIAGMRADLYRDDIRPEQKERNKILINYFLELVQTVDDNYTWN